VKLLFDENLSHQLVRLLADIFSQSVHVRDVGLKSADDPVEWRYAKENGLIIVSKDSDLHQRSFVLAIHRSWWCDWAIAQHQKLKDFCADTSRLSSFSTKMPRPRFLLCLSQRYQRSSCRVESFP
jgi:Domain of unknown function (DUF5615)